jgi:hypothetical protein
LPCSISDRRVHWSRPRVRRPSDCRPYRFRSIRSGRRCGRRYCRLRSGRRASSAPCSTRAMPISRARCRSPRPTVPRFCPAPSRFASARPTRARLPPVSSTFFRTASVRSMPTAATVGAAGGRPTCAMAWALSWRCVPWEAGSFERGSAVRH